MQIEAVFYDGDDPETATPMAMYILIDGKRMAKRANCRWVSIARGFAMHNEEPPHTTLQ
jgi:hypothetical protein